MQLPDSWVDSLFARLQVRYGAAWNRMWEGVDIAAVKADWAAELGGFSTLPDAIAYALEHLPPDFPPTCTAFRALCIARPEPKLKQLPAPKASEESVKSAQASVSRLTSAPGNKDWAIALRKREQGGERLSLAQRTMWREAMKDETAA